MLTFDELLHMEDSDRLRYLKEEAEKVINSADPSNQLKLRAIQARCDGIRSRMKNPLVSAQAMYNMMIEDGVNPLSEALNDAF